MTQQLLHQFVVQDVTQELGVMRGERREREIMERSVMVQLV